MPQIPNFKPPGSQFGKLRPTVKGSKRAPIFVRTDAGNPQTDRALARENNAEPKDSIPHQKKYFSVFARNSVVAGRINTRHTEA